MPQPPDSNASDIPSTGRDECLPEFLCGGSPNT